MRAAGLGHAAIVAEESRRLAVQHQHLVTLGACRLQARARRLEQGLVRHREHAQVEVGKSEPLRPVERDVQAELVEQAEDRHRVAGTRGVVVAGDDDDRRLRDAPPAAA